MDLWVDHALLHAAGRCLNRRAASEADIEALLQLATLLAYSNCLHVSNFVTPAVASRTAEVTDELFQLGVDLGAFDIAYLSDRSFEDACRETAKEVSDALLGSFTPEGRELLAVEPEGIPRELRDERSRFLSLAYLDSSSDRLEELRKKGIQPRTEVAVEYMMAIS